MKAAFTLWNGRIAPVFDTASQLHIVEYESGKIIDETSETVSDEIFVQKILHLVNLGIDILICGAISKQIYILITAYGIRVVPFISGELQEVIRAWMNNSLTSNRYAMPGCCGWRNRLHNENYIFPKERTMNFNEGRTGASQGRSQSGRRTGRMGGPKAGGPSGNCVCLKCGQTEPHERGIPCSERKCPKCGSTMIRE